MLVHLPCQICLQHFIEYVQANPFQPDSVVTWFYELHNDVNRRLNKPEFPADQLPKNPSDLGPTIQSLSVSFPPEFIEHLQRLNNL
jgi:hypothetical protein